MVRKDSAIATDNATELTEINASGGSGAGSYVSTTDSAQAQRDNVGTAGAGLTEVVAEGGGGTIPVNQIPVPASRTWRIVRTSGGGLKGKVPLSTTESASASLFAIDFSVDLPTNGRLTEIDSVEITSGTADGLTFGADMTAADDYGVNMALAKLRITPATAGAYTIRVTVSYDSDDGGGTSIADIRLIVAE